MALMSADQNTASTEGCPFLALSSCVDPDDHRIAEFVSHLRSGVDEHSPETACHQWVIGKLIELDVNNCLET